MNPQEYDTDRNYYDFPQKDAFGLRYRLEGDDVISSVVNILRGGIVKHADGTITYNSDFALMNEEGVARVEFFIRGGVNKINHLTKYKNEQRVMYQMRSLCRGFIIELVENMKRWSPNATVVYENITTTTTAGQIITKVERLINPNIEKIRNKHLVLQVVENALLQSMLRGNEGFEAEITGKSWVVNEQVGQQQQREGGGGFGGLRNLFSRKRDEL